MLRERLRTYKRIMRRRAAFLAAVGLSIVVAAVAAALFPLDGLTQAPPIKFYASPQPAWTTDVNTTGLLYGRARSSSSIGSSARLGRQSIYSLYVPYFFDQNFPKPIGTANVTTGSCNVASKYLAGSKRWTNWRKCVGVNTRNFTWVPNSKNTGTRFYFSVNGKGYDVWQVFMQGGGVTGTRNLYMRIAPGFNTSTVVSASLGCNSTSDNPSNYPLLSSCTAPVEATRWAHEGGSRQYSSTYFEFPVQTSNTGNDYDRADVQTDLSGTHEYRLMIEADAVGAPSSVSVNTGFSNSQIRVTWGAPSFGTPTGYIVYSCAGASGTTCVQRGTTNSSTRQLDINKSVFGGGANRVAVVTTATGGNSKRAYSNDFTLTNPPTAPGLTCTPKNGYDKGTADYQSKGVISCTWTAPTGGAAVTGYKFYSSVPAPGINATLFANSRSASVDVPYDAAKDVQNYRVTVRATSAADGDGAIATATGRVYAIPQRMSSFSATPSQTKIDLVWSDSRVTTTTNETFIIRWGVMKAQETCDGSKTSTALTASATAVNAARKYTITPLSEATKYCIAISKVSRNNREGVKRFLEATTVNPTEGAPNVPTAPRISVGDLNTGGTEYEVTFSWTAPAAGPTPTGYQVQVVADGDDDGDLMTVTTGTKLDVDATAGESINFKVRAYRTVGGSNRYRDFVSGTAVYLMEAPTLKVSTTSTTATMTWTAGTDLANAVVTWDVEYKEDTESDWTDAVSAAKAVRTHTIRSLTAGTAYNFRVGGVNASHAGPKIEVDAATVGEGVGGPNNPRAVSGLATYSNTNSRNELTIRWSAPTGGPLAAGYQVALRIGCTGAWGAPVDKGGADRSHTFVTGITADTEHCVRVRAFSVVGGENRYSGFVTTIAELPSAPTMFAAVAKIRAFVFTWAQSSSSRFARFELEVTHDAETTTSRIGKSARTTTLTGLTAGGTYVYRLRTIGNTAGSFSAWTPSLTLVAEDENVGGPPTPTSAVLTITADANDDTKANAVFAWRAGTGNPAPEGWDADYKAAADEDWTSIDANIAVGTVSKTVSQLSSGVSYAFRVRGFVTVQGEKRYSAYAQASGGVAGVRANPTECSATAAAVTGQGVGAAVGLTLNWTPPTEAEPETEIPSAMVVEYRRSGESAYRVVKLGGTASTYSVPNVQTGERYDFRLYAEFGFGSGAIGQFSNTLVVSIVADLSAGKEDCTTPEDAALKTLASSPEIFAIALQRTAGDRDEVIVRWTPVENARFYELRTRLGYQDSAELEDDGISQARPMSGVSIDEQRAGYAARGHVISHGQYRCVTGCWIGVASPPSAPAVNESYLVRLKGVQHYLLAMYADKSNDSFYMVFEGDAFDSLSSFDTTWFEWDILMVRHVADEDNEVTPEFFNAIVDLDPAVAVEIYIEDVPDGAFTFAGGTGVKRTVVRWLGGGQTAEFATIDPTLRFPVLTPYKGAGIVARSAEQLAYVTHGSLSWFTVRSVDQDNERSGWSAPRFYDATDAALPPPPFPTAVPGLEPPETANDFGFREFAGAGGIGEGEVSLNGTAIMISLVASIGLAAVGYGFSQNSNPQTRVGLSVLLFTASWIVMARTVANLEFSFIAAPLVIIGLIGLVALARRAG